MNTAPPFYRQLQPFELELHGSLQFAELPPDFNFAAGLNVVALQACEVAQAALHYPLVFVPVAGHSVPLLVALLGLGDGRNHFVDAAGQWRAGTYIPAALRIYPFLPMQVQGQSEPVLGIDLSQSWTALKSAAPFADETGHASPRLQAILEFLAQYLRQTQITRELCSALQQEGVLLPRTLSWSEATGGQRQLDGFFCVDEETLKQCTGDSLVRLHQANALGLAYGQMLSVGNLQGLLAASATAEPAGKTPARARKKSGAAKKAVAPPSRTG